MAHHQHRAVVVHEEVLQPDHAGQVQVVGGLVQQDDVRLAEQGLGQQHLDLLPGVHGGHHGLMKLHGDAEALQQLRRVALRLPAAQLGVLLLQLRRPQPVLVVEVRLFVDGVLLLADVVERHVAHDDGLQNGVLVVHGLVLLQHAHTGLGVDVDRALGGFDLPGDDFQKRGFARAVGADDAVAVAAGELQVRLGEQDLPAVL